MLGVVWRNWAVGWVWLGMVMIRYPHISKVTTEEDEGCKPLEQEIVED